MKKILIILLSGLVLVTGCGKKEESITLNLDKVKENVLAVKKDGFEIFGMMGSGLDFVKEEPYNVNTDNFEEALFETSLMNVHASMYIVIKPKEGKKEEVKKDMKNFMEKYSENWSTYLPDQYEMVKNRLETNVGDYLVYVVSEDNNAVLEAIKNAKK